MYAAVPSVVGYGAPGQPPLPPSPSAVYAPASPSGYAYAPGYWQPQPQLQPQPQYGYPMVHTSHQPASGLAVTMAGSFAAAMPAYGGGGDGTLTAVTMEGEITLGPVTTTRVTDPPPDPPSSGIFDDTPPGSDSSPSIGLAATEAAPSSSATEPAGVATTTTTSGGAVAVPEILMSSVHVEPRISAPFAPMPLPPPKKNHLFVGDVYFCGMWVGVDGDGRRVRCAYIGRLMARLTYEPHLP